MSKLTIIEDLKTLTKIIYELSKNFPPDEKFNTTSQMKRAIISVRLNIREGNVFETKKKVNFFKIALGSLNEADECVIIAFENKWIEDSVFEYYKSVYWLCLNKLRKLILSIHSEE